MLNRGLRLGRRNGTSEEKRKLAVIAQHKPWEGRAVLMREKLGAVEKSVSIPEGPIRQ